MDCKIFGNYGLGTENRSIEAIFAAKFKVWTPFKSGNIMNFLLVPICN